MDAIGRVDAPRFPLIALGDCLFFQGGYAAVENKHGLDAKIEQFADTMVDAE